MADNEKIVLGVSVDASSVKPALDAVARDAGAMAQKVTAAGKDAGSGVEQIGVSAGKSAQQTKRELKSITDQIQRVQIDLATAGKNASEALQIKADIKGMDVSGVKAQIAALRELESAAKSEAAAQKESANRNAFISGLKQQSEAIGKTRADLLEFQAAQMGIGKDAAPFIARLRESEGALGKVGVSAGQTRMALQQLPMQFSDIVVSLQGGQKPLTVFLQQGSQIKDAFGGAGPALKAMTGYVLGMVNPLTVVAAGVAVFVFAMTKANSSLSESNGIAVQLAATGRSADMTREQFSALTKELMLLPGVSKDASKAILGEFVKTREIGGALFRELGLSVADFAAATGVTAPEAAKTLAKAFADPAKGAKELEAALGSLTSGQMLTIEAMEKAGDKAGAQRVLMDALKDSVKGLANDAMTPLGREVDGLGNAWDTMLAKVGNSSGLNTANNIFAALIGNVSALVRKLGELKMPPWLQSSFSGGLNGMVFDALGGKGGGRGATGSWGPPQTGATGSWAPDASAVDDQVKNVLELTKSYKSQAGAMADVRQQGDLVRESLKALRAEGKGNSIQAKELEDRLAGVNEKLTSMGKKAAGPKVKEVTTGESEVARIRAQVIETQRYIDTLKSQGLESAKQTEGEKLVVKIQQELMGSLKGVARANKEKALTAAQALAVSQKEKDAILLLLEARRDFEKDRDKESAAQEADILKLEQKAQAMEDQVRLYGMSAEALDALTAARQRERIEILAGFEGSEKVIADIQRTMDANKRIATSADQLSGLDAGVKAAKEADAEWKKTATSIENTLTDSLMRAFEGGKGFAQAMRDTIVNMFKTMVLRPIIQAVMSPVSSAIGSVLGMPGAVNAATSGSGVMGLANNASSLYSAITGSGLGSTAAGLVGSGVSMFAGTMAGNAALGGALGLGSGSATAAALAAAQAGGTVLTAGATTMAGSMASLGSTLAASAGPIGLAIAGVMAVSSLLAKKDSRFGGTYGYDFGGAGATYQHGPVQGATGEQGVRDAINATVTGINNLLKTVGSAASLSAYRAGLETSNKGRGGVMSGGTLSTGATFGESGQGSNYDGTYYERTSTQSPDGAAAAANFATDLKQSIIQALQAAGDVPESIAKLVRGVDAEALADDAVTKLLAVIDAQVGSVAQLRTALLALPFQNLKALSFDAAAGLIDAAGGLEALGNKLGSYYENFYSAEEKRANAVRNIAKTLKDAGGSWTEADVAGASREAFRALVESTNTSSPLYAALLNASDAFSSITPAIESAADKVKAARGNLIDAYKAEATAMQSTVDKFRSFATDLRSFRDGLLTGGLSPLTPGQRYAQTSSQFNQLLTATKTGTEDERIAAIGKLQGASTALLEASKVYNASSGAYVMDFDRVQEALSGAAISALATADVAQLQLDAAKSQLTALGEIDKSVLSVSGAIAALAAAQVAAGTAVSIPGFAVGTNYVPRDMLAQIHQGEAIVPRAYNPAAGGQSANNDALISEVRALREEGKQMREEIRLLREQNNQGHAINAQATVTSSASNADAITKHQSKKAWSTEPVLS